MKNFTKNTDYQTNILNEKIPRGPIFEQENTLLSRTKSLLLRNPIKSVLLSIFLIFAFITLWNGLNARKDTDALEIIKIINDTNSSVNIVSQTPDLVQADVLLSLIYPNDNHTVVVRRGITKFITENESISITKGARLYAETIITQDIDNQVLIAGNEIALSREKIRSLLTDGYSSLTQYQRNKWEYSAKYVAF